MGGPYQYTGPYPAYTFPKVRLFLFFAADVPVSRIIPVLYNTNTGNSFQYSVIRVSDPVIPRSSEAKYKVVIWIVIRIVNWIVNWIVNKMEPLPK